MASKGIYVTEEIFKDVTQNQGKLINILNHNMTKMGNDISWLKRFTGFQVALISAIAVTVIAGFVKIAFLS